MSAYGTKLAEGFAKAITKIFYEQDISGLICNRDYEGEIKGINSKLNILTFGKVTLKNYTGADLTADDITESNGQVVTDQKKAYYFKIKDIDKFNSYIKEPKGTILEQLGNETVETVVKYLLTFWADVAAGQRVGTDYTTGTVTVTVTTGAVVGVGTTFTAAMVGKGFKATGHTKWYRVKTYTDATNIVIEDDLDDETSAYTGGAIAGGTAYTIEAATPITLDASNIATKITKLRELLNKAKVPKQGRYIVLPSEVTTILQSASLLTPYTPSVYEDVVKLGIVGQFKGFKVIENEGVDGDNTNGFHVIAGHSSWLTFADGLVESGLEEDITGNFGKAYKGLRVYGGKVIDERRKAAAELFCKV